MNTVSTPNKPVVTYMPPALQEWLEQEAQRNFESVGAVIRRAVQKLKAEEKKS
jgi:Arc/MetJ-type ribon-helix-helix transcriptional regulator